MIAIGIDPGPTSCGWVVYTDGRVTDSGAFPLDTVLVMLRCASPGIVAIERVQAQGIAGNAIMETCEVSARLYQRAVDCGHDVRWLYRRQVLRALDVTGAGNRDSMIRQRLMEMHGGSGAKGTKATPGPLYGVSSHAWQALAVAVAAMEVRS